MARFARQKPQNSHLWLASLAKTPKTPTYGSLRSPKTHKTLTYGSLRSPKPQEGVWGKLGSPKKLNYKTKHYTL